MTEVKGELTAELALKLTFIMWEDMAEVEKRLGRKLDSYDRWHFKWRWLMDRGFVDSFGDCNVKCCCFLCDYCGDDDCGNCLVDWGTNRSNSCMAACNDAPSSVDYEITPADKFVEYMKTHVRKEGSDGDR